MDWKLGFSYEETVKSLEKYDGVTVLEVINELKEEIRNKII